MNSSVHLLHQVFSMPAVNDNGARSLQGSEPNEQVLDLSFTWRRVARRSARGVRLVDTAPPRSSQQNSQTRHGQLGVSGDLSPGLTRPPQLGLCLSTYRGSRGFAIHAGTEGPERLTLVSLAAAEARRSSPRSPHQPACSHGVSELISLRTRQYA
jgi:hypothetical protein